MEFGMPFLMETDTLEGCARLCSQLGLDFIELNMNFPQCQLPEKIDLSSSVYIDALCCRNFRQTGCGGLWIRNICILRSISTRI